MFAGIAYLAWLGKASLVRAGEPIWLAQAGKVSFARPNKARQAGKRTKHDQRIQAAPKCIDLSIGTHPS